MLLEMRQKWVITQGMNVKDDISGTGDGDHLVFLIRLRMRD